MAPLFCATTTAHVLGVSTQLAAVAANGTAVVQFGGVSLTGNGGTGPQIFNLNGSLRSGTTYFTFTNLVFGQTVVLNISGVNLTANGSWSGFANHNALFNFYQAETQAVSGWDAFGNVRRRRQTGLPTTAYTHAAAVAAISRQHRRRRRRCFTILRAPMASSRRRMGYFTSLILGYGGGGALLLEGLGSPPG